MITLERIESVKSHPNADRLALAKLEGKMYQVVCGLGMYQPGDRVLYLHLDAVLPNDVIYNFGLYRRNEYGEMVTVDGKMQSVLSGKKKNRVKTIRLRGELSQGVIVPLDCLWSYLPVDYAAASDEEITDAFELLGIVKYEIPMGDSFGGSSAAPQAPLPAFLEKYKVMNAENAPEVVEMLMDIEVHISEKLEGMNFSVSYEVGCDKISVNSHRCSFELDDSNPWTRMAVKYDLPRLVRDLSNELVLADDDFIVVYGEIIGPKIQRNIYRLEEHEVRFFDVLVSGEFIPAAQMYDLIGDRLPMVPVLECPDPSNTLRGFLRGQALSDFSNGLSVLNNHTKREGIIIKPLREEIVGPTLPMGRMVLKQRSPEYLLGEKD